MSSAKLLRVLTVLVFVAAAGGADARPGGGGAFSGPPPRSAPEPTKPEPASPRSPSRSPSPSPSPKPAAPADDDRPTASVSKEHGTILVAGLAVVLVSLFVIGTLMGRREDRRRALEKQMRAGAPPPVAPRAGARRELLRLREGDPAFSLVLFDDFLVLLYTEIKMAQGSGALARYAPYLGEAARAALASSEGTIATVLVGAVSVVDVEGLEPSSPHVRVKVGFESNYTAGGKGVYAREVWTLRRRRDARSRAPAKARVIGCPSCGAPLDVVVAGVCGHCGSHVTSGELDWSVEEVVVHETSARGPMLTSDVVEQGTDLATVVADGAADRLAAMSASDPAAGWDAVSQRVHAIFTTFQTAWAARDLASMRPLMSDALFAAQTFWVEEYRRQGLRNVTEGARISKLELCDVTEDAYYDAVTVRVHASSLDYTLSDATGALVSGDRAVPRRYTEYWTVIRGRAATAGSKECPRCGAPLDVGMGGHCGFCKAKVTTADFDWVLSRIEQDEVYRG
ncbi:MAG: Tim44 domain-containing protein [Labilithrix sp.]|nr:Tim44 domain-containing protein [Labilithrix sp.]MCW5815441.1 Tim44 domain-containing protein [Labilithrix sp.]